MWSCGKFTVALCANLVGLCGGLGLATVAAQAAPPEAADPYAAILADQAIDPDLHGVVAYLKALPPSDDNRGLIASLILQLGSQDFARRELAARQLIAMPVVPVEDLRAATADDDGDAEVRLRAQQVLAARAAGNASSSVAVACFRTIVKKKLMGAAPVLLQVLPLYGEEYVLAAGRDALKATTRPEDAALLRDAVARGPTEARVAAVGALAAILGDDALDPLRSLLDDAEPRVKLAAARALADRGDRACLAPLVALLSSRDVRVRHASVTTLRALTGRRSDYAAWLDPDAQAAVIASWQQWLVRDARTVTLNYPVRCSTDGDMGRTLCCLYARNEIIEFDSAGRTTFSVSEPGGCPWACQGLPSGGRLVALYSANCLVEYRADGKERLRIPVPGGPMSVQRLDNGNTLVACNNAQKVVEVDDAGKILWEVAMSGGPCDAVRLDNGHTLITLQNANSVVEIDSTGKETWKVEGLHTPRSATRLDDGNTLVCDLGSGKVIEFGPSGSEAWSQGGFASPFGAQRLASGTTLVSDTQSVKEIDRDGKVVSESKQQSLGRVWRY
ncbi:MAG TPA: HEAT repeat domain-containing protein [Tepidisphaeraceae bacterium]|jgi:hypothetical protein